jgi:hypothetical protein
LKRLKAVNKTVGWAAVSLATQRSFLTKDVGLMIVLLAHLRILFTPVVSSRAKKYLLGKRKAVSLITNL